MMPQFLQVFELGLRLCGDLSLRSIRVAAIVRERFRPSSIDGDRARRSRQRSRAGEKLRSRRARLNGSHRSTPIARGATSERKRVAPPGEPVLGDHFAVVGVEERGPVSVTTANRRLLACDVQTREEVSPKPVGVLRRARRQRSRRLPIVSAADKHAVASNFGALKRRRARRGLGRGCAASGSAGFFAKRPHSPSARTRTSHSRMCLAMEHPRSISAAPGAASASPSRPPRTLTDCQKKLNSDQGRETRGICEAGRGRRRDGGT